MKYYTIPYTYTITGYATVNADSLESAVALVEADAPCPEPNEINDEFGFVKFRYLECSFEVESTNTPCI
jgi:hypothetical protein